jgi:hypothetical protein
MLRRLSTRLNYLSGMKTWTLSILLTAALLSGCAGLSAGDIIDLGDRNAPLTEQTVIDGLKEALRIGSERTSSTLSARGGFSDNPLLRVALPEELDRVASTLRTVGMGAQVDSFEILMNRSAERAAGEAVDVFVSAIRGMTIADAFSILNGPDDAATEYFRERTTDELTARFTPVVNEVMNRIGVYNQYQEVVRLYNAVPLTRPVSLDLTAYITDRTLQGLFSTLATEEKRIRDDPVARTTALLQRVFGSRSSNTR